MAITHIAGIADRGPMVFWVTIATIILATLFVIARLYCRIFIVRNFTCDDRYILAAWIISVGLAVTIGAGAGKGMGRHDVDIPKGHEQSVRRTEYVFSILYNPALMATKTSILMFYLRLSKNTNASLRLASWTTLGIVNIAGTILTLMNIFQCKPISAAWNDWQQGQHCIPLITEFICAAPVNVITDLAILLLPLPVMTAMKLPPRQKFILVGTFMLGIFVTVVDVIRIYYLQCAITLMPTSLSTEPEATFGGQPEFSWQASLALAWSMVEVNVGLICACIPTLKPLFVRFMPVMVVDPNFHSRSSSISLDEPLHRGHKPNDSTTTAGTGTTVSEPARDGSREMSMAEFLVANSDIRDGHVGKAQHRRSRAATVATMSTVIPPRTHGPVSSVKENGVYFGFMHMEKPQSLVHCTAKQSWKYCSAVSVLFLIWGMSYGILNALNNALSFVGAMPAEETLALPTLYFGGGYIFGPLLIGTWILRRDEHQLFRHKRTRGTDHIGGFKILFMTGLCIYGIGTIIFWPCAATNSLAGFLFSNFVVGVGLATIETGANTFLAICGPEQYTEMRLMLAQGVQASGSVFANLVAKRVFFPHLSYKDVNNSHALINVQWTYLAITLFSALLAIFYYYMPLPEVTDQELRRVAQRAPVSSTKISLFGQQLRTVCLFAAVFSLLCYTAGQGCMRVFYVALLNSSDPSQPQRGRDAMITGTLGGSGTPAPGFTMTFSNVFCLFLGMFAVGRFLWAGLLFASVKVRWMPRPRMLLAIAIIGCISNGIWMASWHPDYYQNICIPLSFCFLCMGPIWPLIFAMGIRNQGERTKAAGGFLTMAGSGPAFSLFTQWGIVKNGVTVSHSFYLLAGFWSVCLVYPILLFISADAKKLVDPLRYHGDDEEKTGGGCETTARD